MTAEPSGSLDTASDEFARAMLSASPDGLLLVTTSGEIVFVNDQAARLFGYQADDLVGMPVDLLVPDEVRGAHRAHRTRYRAHPQVRQMGAGVALVALRSDGSTFHAEISLSPLTLHATPYVVTAVRDVSERVAAEDHLHRVLHSLDSTDDAIVVFDAETLEFFHVNDGAARMLGYDRDQMATMTPLHINPYATEDEYRQLVASLLTHSEASVRRESHLLTKDGREIPVEKLYRAGPPDRAGKRWIVGVARDVTERIATDAELERNREALQMAKQSMLLSEDRERIARDLHDTVVQRLFGAGLRLQSIASGVDERTRSRLDETIEDLDETIRELRSAIFSLQSYQRPAAALRSRLLDVVTEAGAATGIDPRLQFEGPIDTLDPSIADELVPTLREALSNVAKHAKAHHVRVVLTTDSDVVALTVTDDGVGVSGEVFGGNGLVNLAERARQLGGSAELVPVTAGGSEFRWTVPNR